MTWESINWEQLGIPYKLTDVKPPTEESVLHARKILTEMTGVYI